jgi:hypothetical protein
MERIKMKKLDFYTRKMENGKPKAVLVSGYTDGSYNYYRPSNRGFWCAVHPFSGLAVPLSFKSTRRDAATAAHAYTDIINKNITAVNNQSLIFQNMIQEVKQNEKIRIGNV